MTPLRKQMILTMQMHGFSPRTHSSYLATVTSLARYFGCSPETVSTSPVFVPVLAWECTCASCW